MGGEVQYQYPSPSWSIQYMVDGRSVVGRFGGKKFKIEIDSSIWREEIQNRNRILDLAGGGRGDELLTPMPVTAEGRRTVACIALYSLAHTSVSHINTLYRLPSQTVAHRTYFSTIDKP